MLKSYITSAIFLKLFEVKKLSFHCCDLKQFSYVFWKQIKGEKSYEYKCGCT